MKIDTGQDRKIIHVISAIRVLKPVASMVEQELHPFEQGSSSEHIDESVPESYRAVYCSTFPPPHRGGEIFKDSRCCGTLPQDKFSNLNPEIED